MKKIILLFTLSLLNFACSEDDSSTADEPNACASPTSLGANSITDTTASLYWYISENAALFQVEYGQFGFTQGNGTQLTVPGQFTNIEDLLPSTQYTFYTRVFCNSTQTYSDWVSFSFATLDSNPYCQDPSNFSIDGYPDSLSHEYIDLTWSDGAFDGSQIQYGIQGFTIGSGSVKNETENIYPSYSRIENLNSDTSYDFYVRNICEESGYSAWIGPLTLSTLEEPANPNCNDPYDFTSQGTGTETDGSKYFDFSWSHENSQNSWEIIIIPVGSAFNTNNVIATSFQPVRISYNSIASGQAYDFYIRSNCGTTNGFSDWVGPVTVTAQ
ncbi:hypothetical protein [uncultured Olleya sp.]|uniref:hypothetical protein n=1 Tax=uncultured Olleya sp. TaxID=757243 RepID=UPI002595EDCA|nr:hypothetical protein [uncultured Olleya sp.]